MTPEQTRTLAYYQARYERMVILNANGLIKTTKDYHRYQEAVRDYYGYRKWLDTYVINRAAA